MALAAGSVAALMTATSVAAGPTIAYVPGSLAEAQIVSGPWSLHEDKSHHAHDASGIVPPSSVPFPYSPTLTGTPYAGLCNASNVVQVNHGVSVMQPYYFPFVVQRNHGLLQGYFDYRPRNQQEAVVSALSSDLGKTWVFNGMALALNPYCPTYPTDPDNQFVNVNGVATPYGSDPTSAADNGLGHPVVLTIGGVKRIYNLDRANGHIDSDQLVIHSFSPLMGANGNMAALPAWGFVSPLGPDGYPALDAQATHTTGLVNPDAIMGTAPLGSLTAVAYVEKDLNSDAAEGYPVCPSTPPFALTNLVNGKPRKKNDDVTFVRIATTTDGVHFTDVGKASGLNDPSTTALNGMRWLGSGSIIKLANGHYGMFFGGGNCLDNDSDAFHFLGYAETTNVVTTAADLLSWTVFNGFDNPILSTDAVRDPVAGITYPANPPIVNDIVNLIAPSQVLPFTPATSATYPSPTGGYNRNYFSGRVYDPQPVAIDDHTVNIVFAGYNTPQPSNNLGDYRTIGRFQLTFPAGYFVPN
jgi:hypothetical protein